MRTLLCAAAIAGLAAAPARAAADDELPALSIYGFLRVDAVIDDSAMSDPRTPSYVRPEALPGHGDGELALHARLSRLGLQVDQWDVSEHTTGEGQVELDFLGGSYGVRLRHAWAALHPSRKTELLIGQTWDLLSPLYPLAAPATTLWNAGNSGGFRPQLRLTRTPSDRLRLAVALAGHTAVDGALGDDADGDGRVDGEAGGLPMGQALIEVRERVRSGAEPGRLGVWGHAARRHLGDDDSTSWSIGGHFYLPVTRNAALLGELTHGRDLAAIGGGLGHGIDPTTRRGVHGTGGWFEVTANPTRKFLLAEGFAFDTARSSDVAVGERVANLVAYLVLRARPRDTFELGAEGNFWLTTFKTADPDAEPLIGRGVRFDLHAAVLF